ncbi:uncharacterized protein LOC141784485 [Halichoeres trimaculatus]|uniref:uncharacterized protein LOC141784485 n=1 Tax=Halichoeres trimaculatus TaxID=147232 RepID=UPI003D9E1F37
MCKRQHSLHFPHKAHLCYLYGWISVTVSEFHTKEAQLGDEVTLLCSNFSKVRSHMFWFRVNSTSNISRISSMSMSEDNATFYQNGTFDMMSNITHLFLNIKHVELWDSGLYFCGFNLDNNHSVIVSGTYLKVGVIVAEVPLRTNSLMDVILGAVIVFLSIVVFALLLVIRKLSAAQKTEEQKPQRIKADASDDLNYAALSFRPRTKSRKRPPAEAEELNLNVLYAATR